MTLSKTQKKYLKGICHHLQPVIMIGNKGLTESVLEELDRALDRHELVKIKLRGEREDRRQWLEDIVARTGAEAVQSIGQTACVFRRNAKEPVMELPR